DLALDSEGVVQITVVFLRPDVRVGPRIDQLRIQMDSASVAADASLEHMGNTKGFTNLSNVAFAAVRHHARSANDLEFGDLRQLGQNVVLHAISEKSVVHLTAQILKWEHGDASTRRCWFAISQSYQRKHNH